LLQVLKLDNNTTSVHTGWTMTRVAQSMPGITPLAALSALGLILFTVILILPL
jgi:hypothetical protein